MAPIRTLLFSTLYPSSVRPQHGIFVETRLRELLKLGGIETRVVAPVPWFFATSSIFGPHGVTARTPHHEHRHGVEVRHPRFLVVPKVGMSVSPLLLALGAHDTIKELIDEGYDFDLIDAHYAYPDGVAAALLAKWFDKPLVITARGSDLNLISTFALQRRMIRWAAEVAQQNICVSQALADRLVAIGVPAARVVKMPNGVDVEKFVPIEKVDARMRLGLEDGPWLLSVGNLVELKRHELIIEALEAVRRRHAARLIIVGDGPLRAHLLRRCVELGLQQAVRFIGAVPQAQLPLWYSAADLLVLASSREGWPNVLLEALACGTPVVASNVGGVPEIVRDDVCGLAVELSDANALSDAIVSMLDRPSRRDAIRAAARTFSWQATSQAQLLLFRCILNAEGWPVAGSIRA